MNSETLKPPFASVAYVPIADNGDSGEPTFAKTAGRQQADTWPATVSFSCGRIVYCATCRSRMTAVGFQSLWFGRATWAIVERNRGRWDRVCLAAAVLSFGGEPYVRDSPLAANEAG